MANCWKVRLMFAALLWFTGLAHHELVREVENTPAGMLIYHGLAAATDFLLIVFAANLFSGRLSNDMQMLCYFSMVANFAGWIMYVAYAPPLMYNAAIGVLGYVQLFRLLTMDTYVDRAWHRIIRGHAASGRQLHFKEAQR